MSEKRALYLGEPLPSHGETVRALHAEIARLEAELTDMRKVAEIANGATEIAIAITADFKDALIEKNAEVARLRAAIAAVKVPFDDLGHCWVCHKYLDHTDECTWKEVNA